MSTYVIAAACLTCHDAGRTDGCSRCARRPREPVVSAVAGEERVTPCPLKTPEEIADSLVQDRESRRVAGRRGWEIGLAGAIRADRSHLCSLLDGIRSAHSAGGELDRWGTRRRCWGWWRGWGGSHAFTEGTRVELMSYHDTKDVLGDVRREEPGVYVVSHMTADGTEVPVDLEGSTESVRRRRKLWPVEHVRAAL